MSRFRFAFLFIIWLLPGSQIFPEPVYPVLTGRVVDEAGVLGAHGKSILENSLRAHEEKTGNQVVVVTLKNLRGEEVSEYTYQLGRHWGIGEKDKNNGVILLVSLEEKKIKIEVGYGLEGLLTDAKSKAIIETVIKPEFRARNIEGGILKGTEKIIQVLENADGETLSGKKQKSGKRRAGWFDVILYLLIIAVIVIKTFSSRSRFRGGGFYGGGFGGFSGGGGGGFSGGGGSFGGGGASGNW